MKFYQILVKFKPQGFSDFSFKIKFESEEVSMEKVVPLFEPFNSIFYFKIFKHGKSTF
jgi:hypothetical protein